jgi:hypothetical protein
MSLRAAQVTLTRQKTVGRMEGKATAAIKSFVYVAVGWLRL